LTYQVQLYAVIYINFIMLNISCELSFLFRFCDMDPSSLRIETFIKKYLDFISQLEAEVLDSTTDLHKRSVSWRISVELITDDWSGFTKEWKVNMRDGYNPLWLIMVINYVCTVNAAIPISVVRVHVFVNEDDYDEYPYEED